MTHSSCNLSLTHFFHLIADFTLVKKLSEVFYTRVSLEFRPRTLQARANWLNQSIFSIHWILGPSMPQSPDLEKLLKHFCIIQFGPHGIGKQVDQVSHLGCGLQCPDSQIFNALMLTGFFRFYRLATLVPPSQSGFPPCACSIITKCAKNIQTSRQVQVI